MFGVTFVFILHLLLWLYLCSKFKTHEQFLAIPPRRYFLLCLFFMLLGLLGMQQGDYVHYIDILQQIESLKSLYANYTGYISHMEPQYVWLTHLFHGAYLPWRFCVFSLQYVVLFFFLRKLKVNTYFMFLLILILCMHDFVYQRASWGIILFCCALMYALRSKQYAYLLLCPLAILAHKSIVILFLCLPVLLLRCNKKNLFFLGGVFLFLVAFVSFVFTNTATLADYFQSGDYGQDALAQMGKAKSNDFIGWLMGSSIGNAIGSTPSRLVIIFTVIKMAVETAYQKIRLPRSIEAMLLYSLMIVILAMAFAVSGKAHSVYVNRVLSMASLPIAFVIHYFYENKLIGKKYGVMAFSVVSFCYLFLFLLEVFYAVVL